MDGRALAHQESLGSSGKMLIFNYVLVSKHFDTY